MHRLAPRIALATMAALAGAFPLAAQTTPAPASLIPPGGAPTRGPVKPTPAAAPARPTPNAAHVAAALELFQSIKLQESIPNTSGAMIDSEIARNPNMQPYRDVMLKWLQKYMTWDLMRPELVQLYTDTYTEPELKQLAAFYRTPLGQKTMAKMPELLQRTAMIGARLGSAHSDELKAAMNARTEELQKAQEKAQAAAKTPGPGKPATSAPVGKPAATPGPTARPSTPKP